MHADAPTPAPTPHPSPWLHWSTFYACTLTQPNPPNPHPHTSHTHTPPWLALSFCHHADAASSPHALQHVLYTLTQPSTPGQAPRRVKRRAAAVLDALFPSGRRTRHLISLAFRLLHPQVRALPPHLGMWVGEGGGGGVGDVCVWGGKG